MIRILPVGFLPTMRAVLCLRLELETDMQVIGACDDAIPLSDAPADIVLLDLAVPLVDHASAMALFAQFAAPCPVIVLSLYDDPLTRDCAMAAGAAIVISKHAPDEHLVSAIRMLANRF